MACRAKITRYRRLLVLCVRKAIWRPRRRRNLSAFATWWWVSTWLTLAIATAAEAQYAGKITFQPGLIALCVTIVVIREAVRSSNWVSGLITGVAIFGSYLALTKDLKVPVTERNLLIILGALVFASAFIGLVIAFFGTSISKTRNFNSRSRRQRPR